MCTAKYSILIQLRRIFDQAGRRTIYWAIQALILMNLVAYIAAALLTLLVCVPRNKLWEYWINGKCLPGLDNTPVIISAGVNVVSDFSILALPVFAVWSLSIPLKKKFTIMIIFLSGLLYAYCLVVKHDGS